MNQKKCVLTIFIHGIGSNKSSWNNLIKVCDDDVSIEFKNKDLAQLTNSHQEHYLLYEYDSPIVNYTWFNPIKKYRQKKSGTLESGDKNIKEHAKDFLTEINLNEKDYSNINIVAHSMGGLITLELLFLLFENSENNLLNKINKVLFYASPFAGSEDSEDIKKFFDNKLTDNIFSYAVKELSPNSPTITHLYQGLKKYNQELKKLKSIYVYASLDSRILDESKEAAKSFSKIEYIPCGHSEIKEPKTINDSSYKIFKKFIFNEIETEKQIIQNENLEKTATAKLKEYRNTLLTKKEKKTELEQKFLSKNYIVSKRDGTTTILKNGCVILSAELTIEIIEDGNFIAEYQISTSFPSSVEFPAFKDFNNNLNRFSDFSFNAKILNYTRKGSDLAVNERPNLDEVIAEVDDKDKKELILKIRNCKENDQITLAYSMSVPGEYSKTNISLMKNNPKKFSSSFTMKTPIAVRIFNFQEEIYGSDKLNLNFKPVIKDNLGSIHAPEIKYNLFYKQNKWKIYFDPFEDKKLLFDIG